MESEDGLEKPKLNADGEGLLGAAAGIDVEPNIEPAPTPEPKLKADVLVCPSAGLTEDGAVVDGRGLLKSNTDDAPGPPPNADIGAACACAVILGGAETDNEPSLERGLPLLTTCTNPFPPRFALTNAHRRVYGASLLSSNGVPRLIRAPLFSLPPLSGGKSGMLNRLQIASLSLSGISSAADRVGTSSHAEGVESGVIQPNILLRVSTNTILLSTTCPFSFILIGSVFNLGYALVIARNADLLISLRRISTRHARRYGTLGEERSLIKRRMLFIPNSALCFDPSF